MSKRFPSSHKNLLHPLSIPLSADASIDQMIHWLEGARSSDATLQLADLIDPQFLASDRLIELAAVDLIGQRRRGLEIQVENYAEQFPSLAESKVFLLDLIDAELCVRREMGDFRDADFFVSRFPELEDSIRQLVFLESRSAPARSPQLDGVERTADFAKCEESAGDQFMLKRGRSESVVTLGPSDGDVGNRDGDSIETPIPITPPGWMLNSRCIATAPTEMGRYWLIKGRDSQRNETVAMKIIALPASLQREQYPRILDLCEKASSVAHPTWIAPRIAAVKNGYLAVVRPWVFGHVLDRVQSGTDPSAPLASLVRIAFALSSAHRIGATHGGVHPANVVIGHDGKMNLVDALSGSAAWGHYASNWEDDLSQSRNARIRRDTCGLVQMIVGQCMDPTVPGKIDWLAKVIDRIEFHRADACVRIGEALQARLDRY